MIKGKHIELPSLSNQLSSMSPYRSIQKFIKTQKKDKGKKQSKHYTSDIGCQCFPICIRLKGWEYAVIPFLSIRTTPHLVGQCDERG